MRFRLVLILVLGLLISACASARIERYYQADQAPMAATTDGITGHVLYFKQSMRHFYATLRLTNTGTVPLIVQRTGPEAAQLQLLVEGQTFIADPPTTTMWTPWSGIVEQSKAEAERLEIAPGAQRDVTLRWEFPQTTTTYRFTWQIVIKGMRREQTLTQDLVLSAPSDN